jgi:hypothetical protein
MSLWWIRGGYNPYKSATTIGKHQELLFICNYAGLGNKHCSLLPFNGEGLSPKSITLQQCDVTNAAGFRLPFGGFEYSQQIWDR